MARGKSMYRRLTGRHRTLLGFSQLWLAADHLLLVKSSRLAENYQRFSLSDIQAIVVTELPDRTAAQGAGAAIAILWMLLALTVSSPFGKGFFLATGALAVLGVLWDAARGARCRCFLHTEVSREPLAPVSRMRTARFVLAQLQPAIEAVQGPLEHVPAEPQPRPVAPETPPDIPRAPGYVPEILFVLFLMNAALVLANQRFPKMQIASALPTTFFAEIVLVIVALVRRAGRDSRRIIYGVMAAALVCMGWDAVNVGRSLISLMMEVAQRGRTAPLVINWEPLGRAQAIFAAGWRMAAGAIGLTAAYLSRSS